MVETEGLHTAGFAASEFRKQVEAQTPFGRIGQPHDIAPAAVFLASAEAAWITGETLLISGADESGEGEIPEPERLTRGFRMERAAFGMKPVQGIDGPWRLHPRDLDRHHNGA